MDQDKGQVSCNHPKTSPRLKASCLATSKKADRNSSFPREEHALRRPTLDWDTHNVLKMHEVSYQSLMCLHLSKKKSIYPDGMEQGSNRLLSKAWLSHLPKCPTATLTWLLVATFTCFTCLALKVHPNPSVKVFNGNEGVSSLTHLFGLREKERGDKSCCGFFSPLKTVWSEL